VTIYCFLVIIHWFTFREYGEKKFSEKTCHSSRIRWPVAGRCRWNASVLAFQQRLPLYTHRCQCVEQVCMGRATQEQKQDGRSYRSDNSRKREMSEEFTNRYRKGVLQRWRATICKETRHQSLFDVFGVKWTRLSIARSSSWAWSGIKSSRAKKKED